MRGTKRGREHGKHKMKMQCKNADEERVQKCVMAEAKEEGRQNARIHPKRWQNLQ